MKIAIISDTHDNIPNIDKMLEYCRINKIETILHCGDICARSVLIYMAKNFNGKIYWIYGNVHGVRENMMKADNKFNNLNSLEEEGEVEIDGKKIYLIHYPDQAKELAATGKYDLVFYGHNHKPWEETIGKTKLINPGTLAGLFQKATFAVYDTKTDKLELKILEQL